MGDAKIQLSAEELQLAQNSGIILTKNRVIEKAGELLGELSVVFREMAHPLLHILPPDSRSPKISRGERYEELPYVLLDYPRHFKQDEVFAIRTMFWWGHHISLTLHLKGRFKPLFQQSITGARQWHSGNWLLQTERSEWQHHVTGSSHLPLGEMDARQLETVYNRLPFIKIGCFFRVDQWNEATPLLTRAFSSLVAVLQRDC